MLPKNNYVGFSITQGNVYRKKEWPIKNIFECCKKLKEKNKIPVFLIEKKRGSKVFGALYVISKSAERRLDIYEEYPLLYKKMFFKHQSKKVMTYIMPKKTKLVPPTKRYLNIIKQGYKDCKISIRNLNVALQPVKHLQR